jgi:hypothetical protein
VTPRQALADVWRSTHFPLRMTASEVADAFLAGLRGAGYEVVHRDRDGAVQLTTAVSDVTVAHAHVVRCWDCGWERHYARPKDARAQGTKHRCRSS